MMSHLMCYGCYISLRDSMTPRERIFCGALPLYPHPLDYSRLAVTSHWSKLSIMMFIVEHTVTDNSMATGGKDGGTPWPPILSSSSFIFFSFRLIWCLVCMTPATEPNRDNHFPVDFPWEEEKEEEEGGLFNTGPDAPGDQHWWKKGDHEKVDVAQSRCSLCFLLLFYIMRQIKTR